MLVDVDVLKCFALLKSYYPRTFEVPSDPEEKAFVIQAWLALLGHLDRNVYEAAVLSACKETEQFPPGPPEIYKKAMAIEGGESKTASESWAEVKHEVARGIGYPYQGDIEDPDFPRRATRITDPATLKAVDAIGGWTMLQKSTDDEDISHRARFIEAYNAIAKREAEARHELPMVAETRARLAAQKVIEQATKKLAGPRDNGNSEKIEP